MADDAIPPISDDHAVEPPRAPRSADAPRAPAPAVAPGTGAGPVDGPALGAATERAQLVGDGGPHEPRGVQVRASVHDAAVHGDGIARAIERAQTLAGAAASAGSGQAARTDPPRAVDEQHEIPAMDPLAAAPPIGDEDERRRRRRDEEQLSVDEAEGGVEQLGEQPG